MRSRRLGAVAVAVLVIGLVPGQPAVATEEPTRDLTADGVFLRLQFPSSMEHTISATTRTADVYGRIYVPGVTEPAGQAAGIRAQVGFGPDGSDPGTSASWTWADMAYNPGYDAGSPGYDGGEEYLGTMLPDTTGSLDYTVRWSGDSGATWHYTDLTGQQDGVSSSDMGQLTVNPSNDLTAPAPPDLSLDSVTASTVALSWSPPADADVAGYELFRDDTRLAQVTATSYTDSGLETGQTYRYTVRAHDTSFNRSADSDAVHATPTGTLPGVPTVTAPDPTAVDHTGLPFLVSWQATAAQGYDVEWALRSVSSGELGPWQQLSGATPTATSTRFGQGAEPVRPEPGRTYAFRARAVGEGGSATDWSSPAMASVPLDDRATSLRWSSGWKRTWLSGRFLRTLHSSDSRKARMTSSGFARGFTVVGDQCPGCGRVRVYERKGGRPWVLVDTVDTMAGSRQARQVLYDGRTDRPVAKRSIRLEVVGTKGRPTVMIDAVALR